VFNAKRLLGRKFDDVDVQSDIKLFPFKVINKSGKPYIRVTYCGEEKEFVRHVLGLAGYTNVAVSSLRKKFPR
jgi:molecular chaperone DnaK (HSP70)